MTKIIEENLVENEKNQIKKNTKIQKMEIKTKTKKKYCFIIFSKNYFTFQFVMIIYIADRTSAASVPNDSYFHGYHCICM